MLSLVPEGATYDYLVGHPTTCEGKRIRCSKPTVEHYMKMNLGHFMSLNIVQLTLPVMANFTLSPTKIMPH